jgi:hypothetical protein
VSRGVSKEEEVCRPCVFVSSHAEHQRVSVCVAYDLFRGRREAELFGGGGREGAEAADLLTKHVKTKHRAKERKL